MATSTTEPRVLVLAHVFPRTLEDSMGAFLLHLADALAVNGVSSAVVAPHAAGLADAETLSSVRVHRFHYAPERWERLAYAGTMHEFVARGLLNKLLFVAFNLSFLEKALQVKRNSGARVIHAHWSLPGGLIGALVSILTRCPLVVTTHGTDVEMLRRTRVAIPLARFVFNRARAVTCGSNYLRDQLLALQLVDPARLSVIPMPVNPLFAPYGSRLTHYGLRTTDYGLRTTDYGLRTTDYGLPITIVTVARLTAQKSIDTLIAAMALLRERGCQARLIVAGDGPERAALQAQARELGIEDRVRFAGAVPQVDLPQYYSAASVFVLPSVREGMGLVLAEALLCGAPVIAVDSGGVTDIVRNGETGLLVPERDVPALAGAIQKLLDDRPLAARLAANGAAWVREKYVAERVAARFAEIYAALAF